MNVDAKILNLLATRSCIFILQLIAVCASLSPLDILWTNMLKLDGTSDFHLTINQVTANNGGQAIEARFLTGAAKNFIIW